MVLVSFIIGANRFVWIKAWPVAIHYQIFSLTAPYWLRVQPSYNRTITDIKNKNWRYQRVTISLKSKDRHSCQKKKGKIDNYMADKTLHRKLLVEQYKCHTKRCELGCSGRVSSSCFTNAIRPVTVKWHEIK